MGIDDGKKPQQLREDWLRQRRMGIGGSDAAAVLGLSNFTSAYSLWCEKTGLVTQPEAMDSAQKWGHLLEPVIREHYAHVTHRIVVTDPPFHIRQHPDLPWMLATLDGVVQPIDDRGPGVYEGKTTGMYAKGKWEKGVPVDYYCQVQHNLAVTGYQWASIAVLIGGNDDRWFDIDRDDEFIESLVQAEREFWDCVERRIPPELDGSDRTKEALQRRFERSRDEEIVLPARFEEEDDRREALLAQQVEVKEAITLIENRIKEAMGDASYARIDGTDVVYTWKSHLRQGRTIRKFNRIIHKEKE